jgi:hypothetical protein
MNWDGLRCHDIHTKFHRNWLRHSKVHGGGDSQTHRQQGGPTSLILFFQNKESRLKINLIICGRCWQVYCLLSNINYNS